MTASDVRTVHNLLDRVSQGRAILEEEISLLRSFLPELPKQKTLEEIAWDIHFAWCETSGNDWKEELFGDLETWLSEQHNQLRDHLEGVKSQAHPALPAGMRIADHEEYGRCVVSPGLNDFGLYLIFVLDSDYKEGAHWHCEHGRTLTFIDAKPAHPEFLETEADYREAPKGTIAAKDGWLVWIKQKNGDWSCDGGSEEGFILAQTGKRRVLRWGWTNE